MVIKLYDAINFNKLWWKCMEAKELSKIMVFPESIFTLVLCIITADPLMLRDFLKHLLGDKLDVHVYS